MSVTTAVIIGLILALLATVCSYLFLIPENKKNSLSGFFRFLHDVFNFKTMLIESVSKLLYVFCTFGCIGTGILLLFGKTFWVGLLVLIAGPLVLRVLYELILLFVLLVQNTISINRKLK